MPMTWPSMLNSGPPELPRLIAASVWMKSSYGPWRMSRPRAETIPAVTVPPRPNGLPMASTQSPTRAPSESPNCTAGSGLSDFTCSSAMSPRLVAAEHLGLQRGVVLQGHGDLVGAVDHVVIGHHQARGVDDEAGAQALHTPLGCRWGVFALCRPAGSRLRKSLKNCSNGEPGGNIGISGPAARAALRCLHILCRRDIHHCGQQLGRQVGEAVGRRPARIPAPLAAAAVSGMAKATARANRGGTGGWSSGSGAWSGFPGRIVPHMVRRRRRWQLGYGPPAAGGA